MVIAELDTPTRLNGAQATTDKKVRLRIQAAIFYPGTKRDGPLPHTLLLFHPNNKGKIVEEQGFS